MKCSRGSCNNPVFVVNGPEAYCYFHISDRLKNVKNTSPVEKPITLSDENIPDGFKLTEEIFAKCSNGKCSNHSNFGNTPGIFTTCFVHCKNEMFKSKKICITPGCILIKYSNKQKYCVLHKCSSHKCTSPRVERSSFCKLHKCGINECLNKRKGLTAYCSNHSCKYDTCDKSRRPDQLYCEKHKCRVKSCDNHMCQVPGCENIRRGKADSCEEHLSKIFALIQAIMEQSY